MKNYRHRIVFNRVACAPEKDPASGAVKWNAVAGSSWDIYVMNADGSGLSNLTRTADVGEVYPHASPDGTKVIFTAFTPQVVNGRNFTTSAICCMDMDDRNRRIIAADAQHACWRPDGKGITYTKNQNPLVPWAYKTVGVYTYDLETGKETLVTDKVKGAVNLCWSPDAKILSYFAKYYDGQNHMNIETGYKIHIFGCRPDWSPDGRKVAWNIDDYSIGFMEVYPERIVAGCTQKWHSVTSRGGPNYFRIERDGKEGGVCYFADWSPDGKYLAYSRASSEKEGMGPNDMPVGKAGEWNIWVCRTVMGSGKDPTNTAVTVQLTFDENMASMEPDWAPAAEGKETVQ